MTLRSGVHPDGHFIVGVHRPRYRVDNLCFSRAVETLGVGPGGMEVPADVNFPDGPVAVEDADWVYELPNALPFRGATFISRVHADRCAKDPDSIRLPDSPPVSLRQWLAVAREEGDISRSHLVRRAAAMPEPLLLALATTSTDPEDLEVLAELSCEFVRDPDSGRPTGLRYDTDRAGALQPVISQPLLFELTANNPFLPDDYKNVMVLRPGIQGDSPVVGEWPMDASGTHVFEYLRSNSYIPWGHYAANMANDAIRYRAADLTREDIMAMRCLYYQRIYTRLAAQAGIGEIPRPDRDLNPDTLEALRRRVRAAMDDTADSDAASFTAALWGWNYGFDYAPSGYRLHASHQQIHQQYALIPDRVPSPDGQRSFPSFACGDLVADAVARYLDASGVDFFDAYTRAIRTNRRTDGNLHGPVDLVVYEDEQVMLFVPKAQTSQWELQLMPLVPVGNILEADADMRRSLDLGIWTAARILGELGARMVTSIEFSSRFTGGMPGQRLLYSFLPRLPNSPGAFSEAQLRWINRHYPEDFAAACRRARERIAESG